MYPIPDFFLPSFFFKIKLSFLDRISTLNIFFKWGLLFILHREGRLENAVAKCTGNLSSPRKGPVASRSHRLSKPGLLLWSSFLEVIILPP